MIIYSHPDGGHYIIVESHQVQMKMDDGRWCHAVIYRRIERGVTGKWQYEGKNQFVTTAERWAERFTKVEDGTE